MNKHNLKGFTLIELLVAILIFSIIASVIYSTFSTGLSVWKRTRSVAQVSTNMNSILEHLNKDLRCVVPYKGLNFTGEKNKLYFCYLSNTVTKDIAYREIYRVCYYLDPSNKEAGKFDLFKKESSVAKGGFNIDEKEGRELITALDNFKIEYVYKSAEGDIAWSETWDNPDNMPKAVRITLSVGGMNLVKYISIPAGKLIVLGTE
ncbi:MAG: hypothetical protein COS99_06685 [Candidatus Omnitrophica bacterium CG07_land_8_20_14_0_80_42_15]|uniref:Type II secretion system protein J n=1 Tax=Candidatus Aquitaenariimonas noxiae TaxID=1974741 RepID=A0A2J0KS44_9BACT|nr:MAG: hypothetical protein COS99_06685 [Candidatus Omnitrophica bacterium CG07_land_8_20_14_0_80_42_15]